MHVFISAGEPSGDLHAASLIRSLRKYLSGISISGFGGDKMRAEGADIVYPLSNLSVMFASVAKDIRKFRGILDMAKDHFREHRPDFVVVIDYPGFHWHLAKAACEMGIPVYYFVPPQLWAWGGWRVRKVKRWFAKIYAALPFEYHWYRARNVNVEFVGHPYFDELQDQVVDAEFITTQKNQPGRMIALLPGSRRQEVASNAKLMLSAAAQVHAGHPDVRFTVAAFNAEQADAVAAHLPAFAGLPVEVFVGRTAELIEASAMCLAVSGSVGLEMLARETPAVVVYRLGRVQRAIGEFMMKVPFISLVNLLAGREVFPEFLTSRDNPEELAAALSRWLDSPDAYAASVAELAELRGRIAVPGAADRVAWDILYGQSATKAA